MVSKKINLIGHVFGQLEVIAEAEDYVSPKNGRHRTQWICRCSCGRIKPIWTDSLKSGKTKRCGECFFIEPNGDCMRYICPDGSSFLFDREDIGTAVSRLWRPKQGYFRAHVDGKSISFHRFIMNAKEGEIIDHIDGNTHNNRKSNLRKASQSQNLQNTKTRIDNSTGYKGVSFNKRTRRYEAYININGKKKGLGLFDTANTAAQAYNRAAVHFFGEFARTNVLGSPYETSIARMEKNITA